jgi:hypothetical protein
MHRNIQVQAFVAATVLVSGVLGIWIYSVDPTFNSEYLRAAASFGALGVASQMLAFRRPVPGAYGSAAFLPFLSAVILAPHWTGLIAVGIAMFVAELLSGRPPLKVTFNVAQAVLAAGVATVAFGGFGGQSPLDGRGSSLIALAIALPAFLLVNSIATSAVIAISSGQSFGKQLVTHGGTSGLYDLLALPFVYVFAWFYLSFGMFGAVILAIPLLGIRELYKTNSQLQQTNKELLELMVAAIEARDPYTSGHSRRVAANSRLIAEVLGLSRKQTDRTFVAALLHDVGKIHEVFGPILSKPGRLNAVELEVMKTHAARGAELIQTVSELRDIVLPVKHHHENWDGSGYPNGLIGDAIPLSSRVIMFADTVDAMLSDRPYRAAMTRLQVRAEIIRMRGKQFDPGICDALLESPVWDELFTNAPQPVMTGEYPQLVPAARRVPA